LFVGEIDWHKWKQYKQYLFLWIQTINHVQETIGQLFRRRSGFHYIVHKPYCFHVCQSVSPTNKTGGSYVLIVCQSPLQTRQEDHMYWLSVNLSYKQDRRIICTDCLSISPTNTNWLTQIKVVHMILQSCVCKGDWMTQMKAVHMILQSCL
jgi:hypothetical protein